MVVPLFTSVRECIMKCILIYKILYFSCINLSCIVCYRVSHIYCHNYMAILSCKLLIKTKHCFNSIKDVSIYAEKYFFIFSFLFIFDVQRIEEGFTSL